MIESKKLVPNAYSKSRDYQAILKILDLLICACKSDIDNFVSILNPMKCKSNILPLLASYVGYEYDNKESINTNRIIIKYYPELIRNRGSETGIKLATALSVNAVGDKDDIEMLSMFHIDYVEKEGKINIYIYYPNYLSKIRDLIEVVRPAGVRCELIPAEPIEAVERVNIMDIMSTVTYNYGDGYIKSLGKYTVSMDENNNIVNVDDDGMITYVDEGKTIATEYKISGNEIIDTKTGYRIPIYTERYMIGDKNRVGFGEIASSVNEKDIYDKKGE